jgi:hypothetical protein
MAHSAFWRGTALFAGTLWGKFAGQSKAATGEVVGDDLVSWISPARSRREDELARCRLNHGSPPSD